MTSEAVGTETIGIIEMIDTMEMNGIMEIIVSMTAEQMMTAIGVQV